MQQHVSTALAARPALAEELVEQGLPPTVVRRLEKMGRGVLDARVLFESGRVWQRLERIPLSDQRRCLEQGVEIVDLEDSQQVRNIPIKDLTTEQVGIAFGYDKLRAPAEQRTVLEKKKSLARVPVTQRDYIILKDGVDVRRPGVITWATMLQWLGERR